MPKRVYKLQEFLAHSAAVNCLSIGKKACRLLVTGGEDHKVKLWAVGKPVPLMSLCGHISPVESVAFDSAEALVLAGASTGAIKIWDLEETKMVRTLNGHRSYCTAVEFHPFGEIFASGSMDTNMRIWDVRKKGCVHTYKGHNGGINTVKFTPDGRWALTGGLDNVVKAWDLTAGKLLHDFRSHEGRIQSISFHPLEFLLATGSADKTVKFWDLESFELIGSSRAEATGVRCVCFHPGGSILFCGQDDGLKAYSWEPVMCHDSFGACWSVLGDICVSDRRLLACSYHHNSVGVWVADDITKPDASVPSSHAEKAHLSKTFDVMDVYADSGSEEIKNIYVDSSAEKASFVRVRSSPEDEMQWQMERSTPGLLGGKIDSEKMAGCRAVKQSCTRAVNGGRTRSLVDKFERREISGQTAAAMAQVQTASGRELTAAAVIGDHHTFSADVHARLTKLRAIRKLWGRSDVKGATDALFTLTDHSVQADVVNALVIHRPDVLNLHFFACLLPTLSTLLQSKTERHVRLSMEALLKLVIMFGPVIRSTSAAPHLHAHPKRQHCDFCSAHLHHIHKPLSFLLMGGGAVGRIAQELNLLLAEF